MGLPMSKEWYYASNGQQFGPLSDDRLKQMALDGTLHSNDLVWNESFTEWIPAHRVADLPLGAAMQASSASTLITETEAGQQPKAVVPLGYVMPNREAPVTPGCVDHLARTRPWVMVIAVLLFISIGFMVIGAVALLAVAAATKGITALLSLVYLVLAALYFFPALYLTRYAGRISDVRRMGRAVDLEAALDAQRAFWKFTAIMMLVIIALYICIIPIMVIMR